MNLLEVSCALLIHRGRVLATRRSSSMPHPGKWEFPGGKLQEGESAEESIVREIREELGIILIQLGVLEPVVFHYPERSIKLIPVRCDFENGDVPEIFLAEHDRYIWADIELLDELDWLEADLAIVEQLRPLLTGS